MVKISVIIPVYNAEMCVERCIESVLNQTLRDIEVIIIDDGSTDNSGTICDAFADTDDRIITIHKDNEGVAKARNTGICKATGEYLIFVDADDSVPRDAYEKMYNTAVESMADIIIGDVYRIERNKKEYVKFFNTEFDSVNHEKQKSLIKTVFYRNYCPDPVGRNAAFGYGGPWNKLVRRRLLLDNNISFDSSVKGVFDDIIYSAYIFANTNKIAYINEPVYEYYIYADSITHTYKADILAINDSIFNSWEIFLNTIDEKDDFSDAYYANVLRRFAESLQFYFYHKECKKSVEERNIELKKIIKKEPYSYVAKKVDVNVLSPYHKVLCIGLKMNSLFVIHSAYDLRLWLKKLRSIH